MCAVCYIVLYLGIFSELASSFASKTTVFTGEVIKTGEDRTVGVRVLKNLLTQENLKVPSEVTLRISEKDETLKSSKGKFIFYVAPVDGNVFDVLHYWGINEDDFEDVSSSSLEGRG